MSPSAGCLRPTPGMPAVGADACTLALPPCPGRPVPRGCESLSRYGMMWPRASWRGKGQILSHQCAAPWWPWGLRVPYSATAVATCVPSLGAAVTMAEAPWAPTGLWLWRGSPPCLWG